MSAPESDPTPKKKQRPRNLEPRVKLSSDEVQALSPEERLKHALRIAKKHRKTKLRWEFQIDPADWAIMSQFESVYEITTHDQVAAALRMWSRKAARQMRKDRITFYTPGEDDQDE